MLEVLEMHLGNAVPEHSSARVPAVVQLAVLHLWKHWQGVVAFPHPS